MSENSSNNSTGNNLRYDDSYANQVNNIIDTLDLDSETDRGILKSRFLSEVVDYERRKLKTKKYYFSTGARTSPRHSQQPNKES